ncbi:ATP-grasp domain-containing protein [Ilumatobacter sp.]|uniref:ATP-grasp domain-containing protein n=1 Tax=Ilumatobacter sp. TaxID=1967498 RepID=UPI003AF802F2
MNVILLEPSFPDNQKQFARALDEVGATVIGIGERPKDQLDHDVAGWLGHYEQVDSVTNDRAVEQAVRWVQDRVWVDRLEATVEAHTMTAARVREACTIPGTSVRTAFLCRDKPAMKAVLREAGVPCARSIGATSADDVRAFAADVGYPLIVKPPDGAGASGTHRVDDDGDLERVISTSGVEHGVPVAVEEFMEGHEGFYDTISVDGHVVHEFVSHYYPNVLEAMRTRWISPQFVATNRLDAVAEYDEVKEMGRRVITALGIGTSATHMEWFAGPKGLVFSEIGCRPPGVRAWDLYGAGNDLDLYREWAQIVVHGTTDRRASRRFAAGIVALRPQGDGIISGYTGVDEMQRRYGDLVIDAHLPEPGTPTQGVEAGYMANAWVRARHEDYDHLRSVLDEIGRSVTVHVR